MLHATSYKQNREWGNRETVRQLADEKLQVPGYKLQGEESPIKLGITNLKPCNLKLAT